MKIKKRVLSLIDLIAIETGPIDPFIPGIHTQICQM